MPPQLCCIKFRVKMDLSNADLGMKKMKRSPFRRVAFCFLAGLCFVFLGVFIAGLVRGFGVILTVLGIIVCLGTFLYYGNRYKAVTCPGCGARYHRGFGMACKTREGIFRCEICGALIRLSDRKKSYFPFENKREHRLRCSRLYV